MTPSHGRNGSLTAHWRLLGGFLRKLDLPPEVMVGNSMGGMLTLIQSAHSPETLAGMILVDAAFPRSRIGAAPQPPARVTGLFALYAAGRVGERFMAGRARRLGAEGLVRETLQVCTTNPDAIDPKLVAALVEQAEHRIEVADAGQAFLTAARSIFRAQVLPARYRSLVSAATTPALVIHGADDRLVPVASAVTAARGHDNWRLEVLDGLGHIPQMEAPQRWLQVVEPWLEGFGLSASGRSERLA